MVTALAGNKADLEENRKVTAEVSNSLMRHFAIILRTNVDFYCQTLDIVHRNSK